MISSQRDPIIIMILHYLLLPIFLFTFTVASKELPATIIEDIGQLEAKILNVRQMINTVAGDVFSSPFSRFHSPVPNLSTNNIGLPERRRTSQQRRGWHQWNIRIYYFGCERGKNTCSQGKANKMSLRLMMLLVISNPASGKLGRCSLAYGQYAVPGSGGSSRARTHQ